MLLALIPAGAFAGSIFSFHGKGLGYPAEKGDARILGMGGVSIALLEKNNICGTNPATLTAVPTTALSATFVSQTRTASDENFSESATFNEQDARIFKIVVPVAYDVRVGVSFTPVTDMRAIWSGTSDETSEVTYRDSLDANGNLWAGTFEMARAFGDLSVGMRMQAIRGELRTEWRRTVLDSDAPLATSGLLCREFAGVSFGAGLAYAISDQFTVAATADLGTDLDEECTTSFGTRVISDLYPSHEEGYSWTADRNDTIQTTATYPASYGFGLTWIPDGHLTASAQAQYMKWSDLDGSFTDTWDFALGAEIHLSTDYRSSGVLLWPYRLGVRRESHYITAKNGTPTSWFVSAGFGVPLDIFGRIDYSVEYGRRGSQSDNGVRETIWRHTITIVGWERWFQRRTRR